MSRFDVAINGRWCDAADGDTVFDVATRAGIDIPTLCHDSRLEPVGACRVCLVEIEGQNKMQPACSFRAEPGMEVTTESTKIQRHRNILYGMYLSDHRLDADGVPIETGGGNQLRELAMGSDPLKLDVATVTRTGRPDDANPYVGFDPELCILCARCTRYCDEVEAVNAITLCERAGETTIATVADRGLLDTSCELCGGCIDTCPTGAMFEKMAPDPLPDDANVVRTTCNFCGVGCQVDLHVVQNRVAKITSPPAGTTVNDGNLCVKGRFAYQFIHNEERLTTPLIRGADGDLHPASWDDAIRRTADGLMLAKERYGEDALGFVSSSRCTVEENYLMQKLARAAFGTNNVHQCAAT